MKKLSLLLTLLLAIPMGLLAQGNNWSDATWTISSLNGTIVASGKGTPSARLAKGVYIIRQGDSTRKVILK